MSDRKHVFAPAPALAERDAEIERLRAQLADVELAAASWKREAEINEWAVNRLVKAEALLRDIRGGKRLWVELNERIDAFLEPKCDHEFVGAACTKCGEVLYEI